MNSSETIAEVANFTGIDYGVLAVILSFSTAIGIYFGFFSDNLKTAEDYLVGGHRMKALPIAISLVARYFKTNNFESDFHLKMFNILIRFSVKYQQLQ